MYLIHLKVPREYIKFIFTMYETFKWIKLLMVELQKDDLQFPVKINLGKWLWATQKLFEVERDVTWRHGRHIGVLKQ